LCAGLIEAFEYFGGVPEQVLFDNAKSVVIERDAYGEGHHRWNTQLAQLGKDYGFVPRLCRPYRARTKGKVERFKRYLKSSFVVPLAATLNSVGLKLDVQTANARVGGWLKDVANARTHATTGQAPAQRLMIEQDKLLGLPRGRIAPPISAPRPVRALPFESLQHPLSAYQALLEVAA
jgi:transposase